MKRISILIMAVILVVGLIFTGCGESETTTPTATTPAATTPAATTPAATTPAATTPAATTPGPATGPQQYGGILKIISIRMPRTLGIPAEATGTSGRVQRGCLETLLVLDNEGKPQPWLFESWESSPDQKSFTFHLRKGVKFHDGTDFNAKAVEWNLNLSRDKVADLDILESMDVIDEYTIRINFKGYTNLADFHSRGLLMISPTAYETNGEQWCTTHPVGTGPFEFVSFERDVSLKYKKFDNYWQEGKPYLDGLEYKFIADATIAAISLERGEADVMGNATALIAADLTKKGFESFYMPSVLTYIAGDSAHPDSPYSNQLVREAVEFAIDREAIVEGLGQGYQTAATQICPPGYPAYLTDIGRPYNPTKAKEMLTEAGYPSGFPTRIIQSTTGAGEDYAVAYKAYLKDVGIEAELEIVGMDKFREYLYGDWNNALLEMNAGVHRDSIKTITGFKTRHLCTLRPPGWEEAYQRAKVSDDATRLQIAKDLMRAAYDFAMLDPLFVQNEIYMVVPSLHDHDFCQLVTFEDWSPENAWLSE